MTRAAILATMACVGGCVSSGGGGPAAPAATAEPGLAEPEPALTHAPSDSDAAIASIRAPESPEAVPAAKPPDRWTYSVTPFLWAGGMRNSTTLEGGSQRARATLGDLVSDVDFALMAHAEARHGRFFTFGEFLWADVTGGIDGPRTEEGARVAVEGDVEVQQAFALLAAGYRLLDLPLDSGDPKRVFALELYGAVRYMSARVDVNAERTPTGRPTTEFDADSSANWWDPLVGLRLRLGVLRGFDLTARGEYGGFGVGTEHAALLMAGFDWALADTTSLEAGWAVQAFRYTEGSGRGRFALTEKMSGPYLALTFRF